MIPSLVKIVLGHQFIVLDLNLFVDRIAFEYYLFALSVLREVLAHVLLNVLGVIPSFLYALKDRLSLLISQFLLLIFNFLNRCISAEFGEGATISDYVCIIP